MPRAEAKSLESAETQAKKRRVTKVSNASEPAPPPKAPETDIYADVVNFEENEAKEREAEEDAELYHNICSEIRALVMQINELKTQASDNNSAHIKEKQIQASLKILMLKKLNRLEKMRTKESRIALQKAREQVDSNHLHLQNMLYEVVHLTKEVKKCLEFKSKDEEMDLVSVEEFYAKAPPSVSKPDVTRKDDHQLQLARLQWELLQRKELAAQCKKLEASKENVAKDIEAKKEQLNNLAPSLKSILEATKPLQENLGIPIDKTRKLHELALLLPKALYVLYVQADAYSQVVKWISAVIVGECDKTLNEELHLDDISSADSDSDNEGDSTHRRKAAFPDRRKSGGSILDKFEQKKKECMKKHPLSVVIKITLNSGETLSIEFQWLVVLEIVCVLPTISSTESYGIAAEDLLSSRNILSSLFPGDTGEECPNPSTFYQLHRAGVDSLPTGTNGIGIPYRWAQKLCGIDFMTPTPEVCVKHCQSNLENILKISKKRFSNRLALAKEVHRLETGYSVTQKKLSTVLTSFVMITMQEFSKLASSQPLLVENIIDSTFIFYRAAFQISSAKLNAHIALSPNYPMQPPLILLELIYKGNCTALDSNGLRDIERDVNVYTEEPSDDADDSSGVLTRQVRKLFFCAEIFLHTEYSNEIPVQSSYFRSIQGRNRSHPYRYITAAGGMYTHR